MPMITLMPVGVAEPLSLDVTAGDEGVLCVTQDGKETQWTVSWLSATHGMVRCQHTGCVQPFYVSQQLDETYFWVAGQSYRFTKPQKRSRTAGGAQAGGLVSGELKAPMPGSVLKIPVAEGDLVESGAPVVLMESMKMEMTLASPCAATVKAIYCEEGQLVEMNTVLVTLEPNTDDE